LVYLEFFLRVHCTLHSGQCAPYRLGPQVMLPVTFNLCGGNDANGVPVKTDLHWVSHSPRTRTHWCP